MSLTQQLQFLAIGADDRARVARLGPLMPAIYQQMKQSYDARDIAGAIRNLEITSDAEFVRLMSGAPLPIPAADRVYVTAQLRQLYEADVASRFLPSSVAPEVVAPSLPVLPLAALAAALFL